MGEPLGGFQELGRGGFSAECPGALSWDSPSEVARSRVLTPSADSPCMQGHWAPGTPPCKKPHPCIPRSVQVGGEFAVPLGRGTAFGFISLCLCVYLFLGLSSG